MVGYGRDVPGRDKTHWDRRLPLHVLSAHGHGQPAFNDQRAVRMAHQTEEERFYKNLEYNVGRHGVAGQTAAVDQVFDGKDRRASRLHGDAVKKKGKVEFFKRIGAELTGPDIVQGTVYLTGNRVFARRLVIPEPEGLCVRSHGKNIRNFKGILAGIDGLGVSVL